MPNDPGLSGDTCFYMEATTGDGGAHNGSSVWWLSPDIKLTGPVSGADKADPGQSNSVEVRFHKKAANSDCVTTGDESINVELWVANPSLAIAPHNAASTAQIQFIGSVPPPDGGSQTQLIDWTPPTGLPATDPQSPGHKCLIARCYPPSLTASTDSFFVPDDPHVAQRNICIVPCGGPGAAKRPGLCQFQVATVNLSREKDEIVTLRAVADLKPSRHVQEVVTQGIRNMPGLRRLAKKYPKGFKFELRDALKAEVSDKTGATGALSSSAQPSYEARITLKAGQHINFNFIVDLSTSNIGDAHIFHLTQIGAKRRVQGGLTIVMGAV